MDEKQFLHFLRVDCPKTSSINIYSADNLSLNVTLSKIFRLVDIKPRAILHPQRYKYSTN